MGEPSWPAFLSSGSLCWDGKSVCWWQPRVLWREPPILPVGVLLGYVQPVAGDNVVRDGESLPHKESRAVWVPAESERPLCGPLKLVFEKTDVLNRCLWCQYPYKWLGNSQNDCLSKSPVMPDHPFSQTPAPPKDLEILVWRSPIGSNVGNQVLYIRIYI